MHLARFLAQSPAARTAAASLREGAEVAITFTDIGGDWRIRPVDEVGPVLEQGKATDPDFALRIAPGALRSICARPDADIGDLGVSFFEQIVTRDPDSKIRVTVQSGLVKLTRRGWLTVLARGGTQVVGWLAKKGLRGPGAVATALGRFKT